MLGIPLFENKNNLMFYVLFVSFVLFLCLLILFANFILICKDKHIYENGFPTQIHMLPQIVNVLGIKICKKNMFQKCVHMFLYFVKYVGNKYGEGRHFVTFLVVPKMFQRF